MTTQTALIAQEMIVRLGGPSWRTVYPDTDGTRYELCWGNTTATILATGGIIVRDRVHWSAREAAVAVDLIMAELAKECER